METAKHIESTAADKLPSTSSKQSNIGLLPYVEVNGTRTVSDETVRWFFEQMKLEGTHKTVFYDGRIRTADDFLIYLKSPQLVPTFGYLNDKIVTLAWLNHIEGNHAHVHFNSLKAAWGQVSMELAHLVMESWWEFTDGTNNNLLEVLIGMVPAHNIKALRFTERVGFERAGEIPKLAHNVYSGIDEPMVFFYKVRN